MQKTLQIGSIIAYIILIIFIIYMVYLAYYVGYVNGAQNQMFHIDHYSPPRFMTFNSRFLGFSLAPGALYI